MPSGMLNVYLRFSEKEDVSFEANLAFGREDNRARASSEYGSRSELLFSSIVGPGKS